MDNSPALIVLFHLFFLSRGAALQKKQCHWQGCGLVILIAMSYAEYKMLLCNHFGYYTMT